MDDDGNGGAGTGSDSSGGAGDRSGCGEATEERSDNIADPEAHEFRVRVVFRPCHAVSDHGTQQRLDSTERSYGASGGDQAFHHLHGHPRTRPGQTWERRNSGYSAEAGVDRHHIVAHRCQGKTKEGCSQQRDQWDGNPPCESWEDDQHGKRYQTDDHIRPPDVRKCVDEKRQPIPDAFALQGSDADKVSDLENGDHEGDSCGETCCHGIRDKLDEATKTHEAHGNEEESCHEGCDQQALQPIFRGDGCKKNDECRRGT